jgi:hypothetical protein
VCRISLLAENDDGTLKRRLMFFGEAMSFLYWRLCFGGDFFYGFWWGCGDHCPAYPCSYGHYAYERYGDWGGDEPELDVCGCAEVEERDDVGIVEE